MEHGVVSGQKSLETGMFITEMTRPAAVVPYVFGPPDERKQQMAGNERFFNKEPCILYNQKLY